MTKNSPQRRKLHWFHKIYNKEPHKAYLITTVRSLGLGDFSSLRLVCLNISSSLAKCCYANSAFENGAANCFPPKSFSCLDLSPGTFKFFFRPRVCVGWFHPLVTEALGEKKNVSFDIIDNCTGSMSLVVPNLLWKHFVDCIPLHLRKLQHSLVQWQFFWWKK